MGRYSDRILEDGGADLLAYWPLDSEFGVRELVGGFDAIPQGGMTIGGAAGPGELTLSALDGTDDRAATAYATRRNLVRNPRAAVDLAHTAVQGAPTTRERVTSLPNPTSGVGVPEGVTTGFHLVGAASGDGMSWTPHDSVDGTTYRGSVYIYIVSLGGATSIRFSHDTVEASDVTTVGQWVRVTVDFTEAAGRHNIRTRQIGAGAAEWYATAAMVESPSGATGTYFDGSLLPDCVWEGAAHASVSAKGPYANGSVRTLETWLLTNSLVAGQALLAGSSPTCPRVRLTTTGALDAAFNVSGSNPTIAPASSIGTGALRHLMVVFDEPGNAIRATLDGVAQTPGASADPYSITPGNLHIGAWNAASLPVNGRLGHVAVYKGDKSALAEAHYAQGFATYGTPSPTFPTPSRGEALIWEICDTNQVVLGRLDNRKPGAQVAIPLNAGRRATVTLDASDPAVAATASVAGVPVLNRVLRVRPPRGRAIFVGRIMAPSLKRGSGERTVTLNAFDPWATLDRAVIHDVAGVNLDQLRYHRFGPDDQAAIIRQLVAYPDAAGNSAVVAHGTRVNALSSYATSVTRTRSYPVGQTLGGALTELAALDLGVDIELAPLTDASNPSALVELLTHYPKRGADKSASVVFEYGHGRESALSYAVEPGGENACNYLVAVGSGQLFGGDWRRAVIAQHATSIATYGKLERFEQRETTDLADLRAFAKGYVGELHDPIAFFSFTQAPQPLVLPPTPTDDPEIGTPPSFGPEADYYLGDTIALRAQPDGTDDPELQETLTGRVVEATLNELDNGQFQVQVECAPELDTTGVTLTNYVAYLPDLSTL